MKKRNSKFLKTKKVIRLKIADRENDDAIHNQGYIKLDKPIHNGYNAEYTLRKDILNRIDADVYQEALDACKTTLWCKNEDFKFRDWKTKKMVHQNPSLKKLNKSDYEKLSIQARRFFFEVEMVNTKYWRYGYSDKFFLCTLSYELVVVKSKAYVTHRREHNSILYQRRAELEKAIDLLTDGHPWGGYRDSYYAFEDRSKKLALRRELVEINKIYKGIDSINDVLGFLLL